MESRGQVPPVLICCHTIEMCYPYKYVLINYYAPSVVESFLRCLSLGAPDHAAVHVGHDV